MRVFRRPLLRRSAAATAAVDTDTQIVHDHAGALPGCFDRDALADAGARTRDDNHFSFKQALHGWLRKMS